MRAILITLLLAAALLPGQVIPGRYIVELDAEPAISRASAARGIALRGDLDARRQQVRRLQAGPRAEIARLGGRVKATTEVVSNTLIAELTEEQARALASRPGIRSVEPDEWHHPQLEAAAVTHRLKDAWASLPGGKETAGLGARVAIFDSGIEAAHPGFQDPSLPSLEGYPKASSEENLKMTNSKLIVIRAYDPDEVTTPSAIDLNGHGTGVAMAAAGAEHQSPFGEMMAGAAPKAYIGVYKITVGAQGTAPVSSFLRALDDAVADGMQVGNYSYGSPVTQETSFNNSTIRAIRNAMEAGFQLVGSAGNRGPGPSTLSFPAAAPEVISVGANGNSRIRDVAVQLEGARPYVAEPGNGPNPQSLVEAPMVPVHVADDTGLACSALPQDRFKEKIVLIQRGTCTFEVKINNAAAAGAAGVVVYNNRANELIAMNVGNATLPAMFVFQEDGEDIRARLGTTPELKGGLDFRGQTSFEVTANRLASFSSEGPILGDSVKPDLAATGTSFYTAAQTQNPATSLYGSNGYVFTQGTSFAAPLVAGALAVLRQQRPGLTLDQYRSLIVNGSRSMPLELEQLAVAPVQRAGAGMLDLMNSLSLTVAAVPSTLPLGAGGATVDVMRDIQVVNLGPDADTLTIAVEPSRGSVKPEVSASTMNLDPGQGQPLTVKLTGSDLAPGAYEGFILISSAKTEKVTRVPYWFGVRGTEAAGLGLLSNQTSGIAQGLVNSAFVVRTTDSAGLPFDSAPQVIPPEGARVEQVRPTGTIPGTWAIDVRLGGVGANTFTIRAGSASIAVSITAR